MSEQIVNNETPPEPTAQPVQPAAQPPKVEPTATAPVITGGKTFSEAEVEQMIKDRLEREKQKRERAAQEAAAKAAEEAAKQQGEWQKVAEQREKDLADIRAELAKRDHEALQRKVAKEVGLPESLASRLIGEDEKALTADAKTLLETLPKPPEPQPAPRAQPGIAPANPGANATQGETLAQQRARIHGSPQDAFDPNAARQHGGGAFYRGPKQ